MKKNDITYEYRVFTNRLIDVDSMEVGNCTSKVIKEIKSKDKVDGRFFHTSDTDEWFYCWNGELQKLNLKGDSDVNAALAEVKKLIGEANAAVSEAKATAKAAADAAAEAKTAADNASAAVESIEGKADKSEVEKKADKSDVDAVSKEVDAVSKAVGEKADKADVEDLSQKVNDIPSVKEIALKSDLDGYATEKFVLTKIAEAELNDKDVDLSKYATKEDIANFITKDDVPSVEGLASKQYVNDRIAEIKVPSIEGLATKEEMEGVKAWVNKQGFLTEQSLNGYATESFVSKEIEKIVTNMDEYYTKGDIDTMIENINNMIGQATEITNTILNA